MTGEVVFQPVLYVVSRNIAGWISIFAGLVLYIVTHIGAEFFSEVTLLHFIFDFMILEKKPYF